METKMRTQPLSSDALKQMTRRHFFRVCGYGIGALALNALLNEKLFAANDPLAPKTPHFKPRAKHVIFLFMAGAPSQIDLFDYKPTLQRYDRQPCPDHLLQGERFAFIKGKPMLLGSPYQFSKHGQSGQEISELLPHIARIADDICIVRSMQTDQFNHAPAQIYMNTGHQLPGRPSMGAWLTYGLGTENRDLPGFMVLISGANRPDGGHACWSSGFLPTVFQGVELRSKGEPILFVSNPEGIDPETRRETVAAIADLNRIKQETIGDPEIETRINSYELAYRMQTSVPELMDISKEPESVLQLYGATPGKPSFANNCLLARRMVERGVRFVQLYHRGWDHHGTSEGDSISQALPRLCSEVDRASAALVIDLKQRGLLDETLVIWGGEFGRTPMNEGRGGSTHLGRDHHPRAFTVWMAGGGVKPGITYGATDELGYTVTENPVHVHDLHATILHLMGIDHTRLTYWYQGRNFRLTDVSGRVVQEILG
ncbi:MAG: sulfatase [Fimbriimonadales bacterium]|nr:MAG: sulfatase [Fimbriimonadales bacterium]